MKTEEEIRNLVVDLEFLADKRMKDYQKNANSFTAGMQFEIWTVTVNQIAALKWVLDE